jgi:hypothetical protein
VLESAAGLVISVQLRVCEGQQGPGHRSLRLLGHLGNPVHHLVEPPLLKADLESLGPEGLPGIGLPRGDSDL